MLESKRWPHLTGGTAARVILSFATAYFISFGLRGVNAVLAPDLIAVFGLTNASLGGLTAAYFLGFMSVQLPLGVVLDRFGARRVHAGLILIAALGCALEAAATSFTALIAGRVLIGVGVAAALMASYKAFRHWFAADRQPQLVSWMLMAGATGALTSTLPVQMLVPYVGWRGVFWICAVLLGLCSLAIYFFLPRDEEQASAERAAMQSGSLWQGYGQIFSSSFFWRFAIFSVAFHSHFISLQTLWIVPWCVKVFGFSAEQAAGILFGFNLSLLCGFIAMGPLVPRALARGITVANIAFVSGCIFLALALTVSLVPLASLWWLFIVMGLGGAAFNTVQPYVAHAFPINLSGRVLTAYNLMIFGGLFLVQWAFGIVVDIFIADGFEQAQAFRFTMFSWACVQALSLTVFWFWRPPPPLATQAK